MDRTPGEHIPRPPNFQNQAVDTQKASKMEELTNRFEIGELTESEYRRRVIDLERETLSHANQPGFIPKDDRGLDIWHRYEESDSSRVWDPFGYKRKKEAAHQRKSRAMHQAGIHAEAEVRGGPTNPVGELVGEDLKQFNKVRQAKYNELMGNQPRDWAAMAGKAGERAAGVVGFAANQVDLAAHGLFGTAARRALPGQTLGVGVGGAVGRAVGSVAEGVYTSVGAAEMFARVALTGRIRGGAGVRGIGINAAESWMPGWKSFGWADSRKYLADPAIAPRLIAAGMVRAPFAALAEAINPAALPPSIYVDAGGSVRHANDMGASARFGRSTMGRNSIFNSMREPTNIVRAIDAVI